MRVVFLLTVSAPAICGGCLHHWAMCRKLWDQKNPPQGFCGQETEEVEATGERLSVFFSPDSIMFFKATTEFRSWLQRDDVAIHYLTDTQIRQLYDIRFER